MLSRHVTIVIFSLSAVFSTAYATKRDDEVIGGYKPIKDLNDPYIQGIAKFAIDEYNKKGNHIQLVKIDKGESQVVAGTNYRLTISANDTHQYLTIVYDRPWDHYRILSSFVVVPV
ncbi:Cysteine proteinase inhibitor 5 [Bienertia sinuspersici]